MDFRHGVHMGIEQPIYLMGLDLGTSAIKGVVVDEQGNEVAAAEKRTTLEHPEEGWVESDPEQHYRDICEVIRDLVATAPGDVAALAMSAASGNTLLTDGDGRPLTPIISWMDQRAAQNLPNALKTLSAKAVHQISGWPCVDQFPLAHLAWLRENRGDLFRAAEHCGMNTDWILFRLTGNWIMDHSTATTFLLQDQVTGSYHPPFLNLLDIPEESLSPLADSGVLAGALTREAARDTGLSVGTAVITGCFDHPSAARSVNVVEPGTLMLSCGTSWVGFFPEMDREKIIDAGLLCDPFLTEHGGPWGAIFSVPYIGRAIDWYVDNVIALGKSDRLRIFDDSAAEASPGAGGLQIDLREPPRKIAASRCDISRAVMEGAATLLNGKIQELAARGMRFEGAVMVGGPSRSPVWPGIVGEITGLKLSVGSAHAGAQGAAILAGEGIGICKNEQEIRL